MDVFVAIVQAKLDIKGSNEECSWLQNLFQVVCDYIYKPSRFNKPCEELCLDIVNVILTRNGNKLPIDHTVLSTSSLCAYEEGKYFTGQFGLRSEALPDLAKISGFNVLEERPLILLGFLTDIPKSDKTLHLEAGLLYLEDTKSAVICQLCEECGPEKYVLNNLVLLPKWNFIDIQFPVFVFESDKGKKRKPNCLKYIEVVENLICIQKQESAVVPKALSIQEFSSKTEVKPDKARVNIIGCLKTLGSRNAVFGQKPYFLAQFYSPETNHSTSIAFWGYRFASWYNLMKIGETYVVSEVQKTTMNKGHPNERELLAATKHSDFYKVDPQTYTGHENSSAECDKGSELQKREEDKTDEEQLKRKRDETEKEPEATGHVKRCEQRQKFRGPYTRVMPKSDAYFCSAPIGYEGMITAVVNSDAGLYEIDNKFRLFTHYMPCKNFGCGMRAGASVTLYHIHLCKLGQKVLGLVCCNSSTIRVAKHSMLDSPFQYWVSGASYIYHIFHCLSLVDFSKALDLCELLTKKFQPTLSGTDIVGPRKSWHSAPPTILSHVIDLETLTSPSSRDMFDEFFSNPHRCIVTMPLDQIPIPTPLTLKDLLSLVDELGTRRDEQRHSGLARGRYGWNYQEITQKELLENVMLLGWISNGNRNGKLYFCDVTSNILCLITESEVSETIHKCDAGCLINRHDMNCPILPHTDEVKPICPLPQTTHLGAILKLTSFKIIMETFNGLETISDGEANRSNPLKKIYLVFSARDAIIIGKVPEFDTVVVSKKQKVEENVKNDKNNGSGCRFVFLVKHKELQVVEFKNNAPSLTACVHGYILAKHGLTSQTDKEGGLGSHEDKSGDVGPQGVKKGDSQIVKEVKTVTKQELIIEFTNSCWLDVLHPGRFYYIIEHDHLNNTCQIEHALERKIPVIPMSSNVRFEEIDTRVQSCDDYKDWALLAEQFIEINSVRMYLSKWEHRKPKDKLESTNFLVSLRGIILARDTVHSNDNQCPFPSIPSGQMYLPRYGLISAAQASALSLGYCYLGNRSMVLTVRDILTADSVKMYLDFSTRTYPIGLLPGAVVTFRHLQQHISKQGNLYLSFEACSSIKIESLPMTTIPPSDQPKIENSPQHNSLIESRRIIDYFNFQSHGKLVCTLSYVLCRIIAVQKVSLKWTCSKCGRLPSNCYCHVSGTMQTWVFSAQARCLVEDGTGEAMLFIEDHDLVRQMLFVKESTWLEIKNMSRKHGEVWYQRSAYWKNGRAGGDSKADQMLSSMVSSHKLYRRIKILCKQFKMASIQGKETRTIRVDGIEHTTDISFKITLNVLEIHEINYRNELKTSIVYVQRRLLNR